MYRYTWSRRPRSHGAVDRNTNGELFKGKFSIAVDAVGKVIENF
jgi:hypothetical protein